MVGDDAARQLSITISAESRSVRQEAKGSRGRPSRDTRRFFQRRRHFGPSQYDRYIPKSVCLGMLFPFDVELVGRSKSKVMAATTPEKPTVLSTPKLSFGGSDTTSEGSCYRAVIAKALGVPDRFRVLQFGRDTALEEGGMDDRMISRNTKSSPAVVFDLGLGNTPASSATRHKRTSKRQISVDPYRVLDAPGLLDDFYAAPLAWSKFELLAIGLGMGLYLWSDATGARRLNCASASEIYCLSWSMSGQLLGCAQRDGTLNIMVFKNIAQGRLRPSNNIFKTFGALVTAMAWKPELLPNPRSGTRGHEMTDAVFVVGFATGRVAILNIKLEENASAIQTIHLLDYHLDHICGIAWNTEGTQIATGGNDNQVTTINYHPTVGHEPEKLFVWPHLAAVKALAYCPWQKTILATGGGAHDRHIRFFNTVHGTLIGMINVAAQITALVWSPFYRELCAVYGYTHAHVDTKVALYSWPDLHCIASISMASDIRALFTAHRPMGEELVVCGSDETIRFYDIWPSPKKRQKLRQEGVVVEDHLLLNSEVTSMREFIVR